MVKGSVKVIPWFVQFVGAPLPLENSVGNPSAIACAEDVILVASTSGTITGFSVKEHIDVACIRIVSTDGVVSQLLHNTVSDTLVSVEGSAPPNYRAVVYSQWRRGTLQKPISSAFGTPGGGKEVAAVEVDLPGSCVTAAVCSTTGNIAAATDSSIHLYTVGSGSNEIELTPLLHLTPKTPILQLALCCDFVGYCSAHEAYVLRLTLGHRAHASDSDEDGEECDIHEDVSSSSSVFTFDADGSPDKKTQLLAMDVPSLTAHTAKPAEALGSVRVADHALQLEPQSRFRSVVCDQFLYRQFESNRTLHTLRLLPSYALPVELMATLGEQGVMMPSYRVPETPLHADSPLVAGVCCFVSHSQLGYMYNLSPTSRLLSEYTYKTEGCNSVAVSDYLLYLTTPGEKGSIDTYTVRNVLPNKNEDTLPTVSLVGTHGGILSPIAIDVADRNVAVLTKEEEGTAKGGKPAEYNVYSLEAVPLMDLYNQMRKDGAEFKSERPFYLQLLWEGHFLLRAKVAVLLRAHQKTATADLEEEIITYTKLLQESCMYLAEHIQGDAKPDWYKVSLYYTTSSIDVAGLVERLALPCCKASDKDCADMTEETDIAQCEALVSCLQSLLFDPMHAKRATAPREVADVILRAFAHIHPTDVAKVVLLSPLDTYSEDLALHILSVCDGKEEYITTARGLLYLKIANHSSNSNISSNDGSDGSNGSDSDLKKAVETLFANKENLKSVCLEHPQLLHKRQLSETPTLHFNRNSNSMSLVQHSDIATPLAVLLQQQEPEFLKAILMELQGKVTSSTALQLLQPSPESDPSAAISYLRNLLKYDSVHKPSILVATVGRLLYRLKDLWRDAPSYISSDSTVISYENYYSWLDLLPPAAASTSPVLVDLLRQLQSLFCHDLTSESAEHILQLAMDDAPYIGSESLELLCLPHVGKFEKGFEKILAKHPDAALGYATSFISDGDTAMWCTALNMCKSCIENDSFPPKAYGSILNYASSIMDPVSFLDCLPTNGNVEFFLPFITKSHEVYSSETMLQDVEREALNVM